MKTLEGNKCGLECIRTNVERVCVKTKNGQCPRCEQLAREFLDRIQQLEQELAAVERERDAAVESLRGDCREFKYFLASGSKEPCASCPHWQDTVHLNKSNWEWRGVCPENTEVQENDH